MQDTDKQIADLIFAALARLRDEKQNPRGFKRWQRKSDKAAIQRIARFVTGL